MEEVNAPVICFMYRANLNNNQQLTVINQGTQTLITLISSSLGQQQSQSSSFTTGNWNQPPRLYQTESGLVLEINSAPKKHFFSIQSNSINVTSTPAWPNTVSIDLESTPETNQNHLEFEPMQPMQPMQPMKMGNMSMNMNPMSMKMGNMSMTMGENKTAKASQNFCSKCGAKVKPSDRFCRRCGHNLMD